MPGYVVSTIRSGIGPFVLYEIVTDRLQRMYVAVPREHTDATTADDIIRHTITARSAPGEPLR